VAHSVKSFAKLEAHICSAMILYYIGQGNTQLAQVQAFVLLASFLCSVNCLPQAWLMVGQAVRTAQDLGLHVSVLSPGSCRNPR